MKRVFFRGQLTASMGVTVRFDAVIVRADAVNDREGILLDSE